jgi:hypothetical protein
METIHWVKKKAERNEKKNGSRDIEALHSYSVREHGVYFTDFILKLRH